MKKLLITAIFLVVLVFSLTALFSDKEGVEQLGYTEIVFKGESFVLEVAQTEEERVKGLSGRENLPEDTVLLFVFPTVSDHGIWMKDMFFSIDIIWMDEELVVVDYRKDVSPDTFPEIFYPEHPAKYVLEANTGFVEDYNLEFGDYFELKDN